MHCLLFCLCLISVYWLGVAVAFSLCRVNMGLRVWALFILSSHQISHFSWFAVFQRRGLNYLFIPLFSLSLSCLSLSVLFHLSLSVSFFSVLLSGSVLTP